ALRGRVLAALGSTPVAATEWGPCAWAVGGRPDFDAATEWLDFFRMHNIWDVSWAISDDATLSCSMLKTGADSAGAWHAAQLTPAGAFARASLRTGHLDGVLGEYVPVNGTTTCSSSFSCLVDLSVLQCAMLCDASEDCGGFYYEPKFRMCSLRNALAVCSDIEGQTGGMDARLFQRLPFERARLPAAGKGADQEAPCGGGSGPDDGHEYLSCGGSGAGHRGCCARARLPRGQAAWAPLRAGRACSAGAAEALGAATAEGAESACALRCALSEGCAGFAFRAPGGGNCSSAPGGSAAAEGDCLLLRGACEGEAATDDACWDEYSMTGPPAPAGMPLTSHDLRERSPAASHEASQALPAKAWALARSRSGCANWHGIAGAEPSTEPSAGRCGERCQGQKGCTGFAFQGADDCSPLGIGRGTCVLWFGPCQHEADTCWDQYAMLLNASAAAGSAALRGAAREAPAGATGRGAPPAQSGGGPGAGAVVAVLAVLGAAAAAGWWLRRWRASGEACPELAAAGCEDRLTALCASPVASRLWSSCAQVGGPPPGAPGASPGSRGGPEESPTRRPLAPAR
ncbi:unnamed protein product, partial [Prorocentrum cordatum]